MKSKCTYSPTGSLATGPGIDKRTRAARRWKVLHAQFVDELRGPISASTEALLNSLVAISLQIEAANRAARRDEPVESDALLRLAGQQSRLLRQLRLVSDPVPQKKRRLSPVAEAFDKEVERRSDGDEQNAFGELGEYVRRQWQRTERLAAKLGISPDLFDSSKGGLLNPFEVRRLQREGKTSELKRMICEEQRSMAAVQLRQTADLAAGTVVANGDDAGADEAKLDVARLKRSSKVT
jgi:hypothetical protein